MVLTADTLNEALFLGRTLGGAGVVSPYASLVKPLLENANAGDVSVPVTTNTNSTETTGQGEDADSKLFKQSESDIAGRKTREFGLNLEQVQLQREQALLVQQQTQLAVLMEFLEERQQEREQGISPVLNVQKTLDFRGPGKSTSPNVPFPS